MSVIPASRLSRQDLALLGNNVGHARRPRGAACNPALRRGRRELAAVNRSLALLGERLARLDRPTCTA